MRGFFIICHTIQSCGSGGGQYEQIDNDTLKKLKAIQELDSDTKAHIFATIDAFIKASKL